jgi:hypothetical protein
MHWKPRTLTWVWILLAVMTTAGVAQVTTTQVADTIYHADGTTATGTAIISWPSFTTAQGSSIPSGSTSTAIAAGGALSVPLVPNAGSTPMGSYYTVVYHLDDGSGSREYWVVPVSTAAVKVSAIRSTVLPTSVAMQTVSKSYVDTAIAAAVIGHPLDSSTPYVLKAGDTMNGPLVLPADPVSALQAADKNYVDTSVATIAGGGGQKVSISPSATQIVAQPTGTDLIVNELNDVEYASQYANGRGGNGVANAVASPDCVGGCEVKVEQNYVGDSVISGNLNDRTHVTDARGGAQQDTFVDPAPPSARAIDLVSRESEASIFQRTGNEEPAAIGLTLTHEAIAGGSNLFSQGIDPIIPYFKMQYSAMEVTGTYNTQGQHVLVPDSIHCYGVGDCLIGSHFLYAQGGFRDGGDEGAHPFDLEVREDSAVFTGTCGTGCTTGSTAVMVATTGGNGTQGDGRFAIDKNPAKVISGATDGSVLIAAGGGPAPYSSVTFSGTSFPVSVFLTAAQAIPSQANNQAPGTVTFAIATTGVPAGYATSTAAIGSSSGVACVVDQPSGYNPHNYEMASYTVVDGTHLQMTLNKPHQILATVAFGGLCGYGLEQTVDTSSGIRQVFPVMGTYSATGLYYAAHTTSIVGTGSQTSGFLNLSASIASAVRSGNVVTVTTAGNLAADVNGLTVTVAGVADSSYNGSYTVTTIAPNAFTYNQSGANGTTTGGTVSLLTGGYALYPMAEVLSVMDPATKTVDGLLTLAPNTVAWAAGDAVEMPHYYEENLAGDTEIISQITPRPTTQDRTGLAYQGNNGPGLIGWSIQNQANPSTYLGYGGTHNVPDVAYEAGGSGSER